MGVQPNGKGALHIYQLNKGGLETVKEITTESGIKCGTFGASSIEDRSDTSAHATPKCHI